MPRTIPCPDARTLPLAQARGDERLDASNQAVYGKLRRLPIGVSEALLDM